MAKEPDHILKVGDLEVEVYRCKRKTMGLQVTERGVVQARIPKRVPLWELALFVEEKEPWIEKARAEIRAREYEQGEIEELSDGEILWLTHLAEVCIPDLAEKWAKEIGVEYGRISVRHPRTQWGSCTAEGNLSFNCLLMLTPPDVRDYVVVHELCHIRHLNHSRAFWREVERVLPEYREAKEWLKTKGRTLIARLE